MTRIEVLRVIQARDPDGKPTEPTAQDRQAFWLWVEQTYGVDALDTYLNTPWDNRW